MCRIAKCYLPLDDISVLSSVRVLNMVLAFVVASQNSKQRLRQSLSVV